jgi:uncharacterized protein YdaU (DUF1376 family)
MGKQKPPAYQHYAKDFLAGTSDMSCAEVGAYIRLLDHAWDSNPIATLPNDDTKLRRMAGADPEEWATIRRAVLAKFRVVHEGTGELQGKPGRLVNDRLMDYWKELEEYSENKTKAAEARWKKKDA